MPFPLRKPPGKSPGKIPALLASNGILYVLLVTSQPIAKSFQVSHRVVLKVIPLLLGFTFVAIDHLSGLRSRRREVRELEKKLVRNPSVNRKPGKKQKTA